MVNLHTIYTGVREETAERVQWTFQVRNVRVVKAVRERKRGYKCRSDCVKFEGS